MRTWNLRLNTDCILCGRQEETLPHLFFSCQYSAQVWGTLMSRLLAVDYSTEWDRMVLLLHTSNYDKTKLFLFQYAFQATVYHLWRERNNRRHGETPSPAPTIIRFVDKVVRNRISSIRIGGDDSYAEGLILWFGARNP